MSEGRLFEAVREFLGVVVGAGPVVPGISWGSREEGDRNMERRLKRRKEAPRLCPICREA